MNVIDSPKHINAGTFDLHTHTIASDGQHSPEELVFLAYKSGLKAIAVTDHDTTDSVTAAIKAGSMYELPVICGLEFSALEYRELHILGYGFNMNSPEIVNACRTFSKRRQERQYRIADFLKAKGVDVSIDEVSRLSGGNIISRAHFARVMLMKGYVSDFKEAFTRYLSTDEFAATDRDKPTARHCINIITEAGGVAVLAHPGSLRITDDEMVRLIKALKADGLWGLECYYGTHTQEQTAWFLELARANALNVTGGSDFHGENVKPSITLGMTGFDDRRLTEQLLHMSVDNNKSAYESLHI